MSGWSNRLRSIVMSSAARRDREISRRMQESMGLNGRIDKRIEQYLCRGSYNRGIFNLVRRAVQRELAQREIDEHHICTRTVGAVSIRDEMIIHTSNPDSAAFTRDQHRREAWKHRARQHHVDRAGVCTGKSECPCPNCRECREFYRLREMNPNSVGNWARQMFTDPPACDDQPQKESLVMTPYETFILFAIHATSQSPLPNCGSGVTNHAVASLLKAEMIEHSDNRPSGYQIAERGKVYINAIFMLPLPIRTAPPWVMPG